MIKKELLVLGDVFLSAGYQTAGLVRSEQDYVFNLEAPITIGQKGIKGKVNLSVTANYIEETFGVKPLAVCLANNYLMDYGDEAYLNAISELERSDIGYLGTGDKSNNFNNPYLVETEGGEIALLAYCYMKHIVALEGQGLSFGPAPLDVDLIERNIKRCSAEGKRIIIQLHWGGG